jgi:hypothetical protein
MAEEQLHSVTRKRFDPEDKRLGRHVLHDSRGNISSSRGWHRAS